MKKGRFVLVSLLIFVMVLLAACSGQDSSSKDPKEEGNGDVKAGETTFGIEPFSEKQVLRIGFFAGSPHANTFYIADQQGYFKELNIELEYVPIVNGPAMMEAYQSWDIGTTGAPGVIVGNLGPEVRMIGISDYEDNLALFVREDSPINKSGKGHVKDTPDLYGKPEDWKGTEWLYPAGTNLHLVLTSALNKQGLTIDDVDSVNMDVTSALTAFKGGQGDGLAVWNAFAFSAEDAGFIRVTDAGKQGDVNVCGLVATKDALENKRELMKKAYEVYYRTWEWATETPENFEKSVDYYVDHCDEQGILITPDIAKRSLEYYKVPTLEENYKIMTTEEDDKEGLYTKRKLLQAENDLNHTMDFFITQGRYTEEDRNKILDKNLVDNSIAKEVMESLNK